MSSTKNLNNKPRVLHVIDHLGVGGAQTIVKFLINNVENSFSFVLRGSSDSRTNEKIYLSGVKGKWCILPLFRLLKIINDKEIQIIQCHLFKSKIFGLLIKLVYPNIILIFHEHGSILKCRVYITLLKIFSVLPDMFLVVSEKIQNELVEEIPSISTKINVLTNAVFIEKPNDQDIRDFYNKYKLKRNIFTIGFVGRLHPDKGIVELIQAASELTFEYQLIIVGEGNLQDKLKEMVNQLNMSDKVVFIGPLENVGVAYSTFDVLVAPSKNEAFGLTALEAQTMGVPVITSNQFVGINKKSSLILEDIESDTIISAINTAHADKSLRVKLINTGKKNVKKYSSCTYIYEYGKILNKICKK